jgi:transcriptional regulator with XRE-family HTH domain
MSNENYARNELDSESLKLLDENDSIVDKQLSEGKPEALTGEALKLKQDSLYEQFQAKCAEIRSRVATPTEIFEAGESTEVEVVAGVSNEEASSEVETQFNLKAIRKSMEMTQIQFAKKLGVSQSQLSLLEKGKVSISEAVLAKVAKLQGTPVATPSIESNDSTDDVELACDDGASDEDDLTQVEAESFSDDEVTGSLVTTPIEYAVCGLKAIRKSMEMTQSEFAKKLGLSQALVSQVEKGKVPMSDALLGKLTKLQARQ